MNKEILLGLAENLMRIEGNVRGDVILSTFSFVKEKKSDIGIQDLERTLEEIGYPLDIKKINPMSWYSEALSILVILTAKEIFDWNDDDIFEMGQFASRKSFIVRTVMKYFVSIEKVFKEASKYWDKYFDFGELEVAEADEKRKIIIVRVKGHKFHPDICLYWSGYFSKIAQICLGTKQDAKIKETKCAFKGDLYHEYSIEWE